MTLLEKHQEIIDAWFARWLAQERARIKAVFARRTTVSSQQGKTP
jgi:hypothetical protein